MEIDLLVTRPTKGNGKRLRLVEVKGGMWGYSPSVEEEAKIVLQVFRHALLVGQHRLEGIEYVIRGSSVSGRLLNKLTDALKVAGVSYLIRIEGGKEKKSIPGGLSYEVREQAGSDLRTRPLPFPPLPKVEREEGEEGEREPDLPWTKEMKRFLDGVIEGFNVKKQKTLSDFMVSARNNLRVGHQDEIMRQIESYLEKENPPQSEAIRRELSQFRAKRRDRLSDQAILCLVRISALAVGALDTAGGEGEPAGYTEDALQYWSVNRGRLVGEIAGIVGQIRTEITENKEFLDLEGQKPDRVDYDSLASLKMNPDISCFRSRRGNLNLRQMGEVMEETSSRINWGDDLVLKVQKVIADYDALLGQIERGKAGLPSEESKRVEEVFKPIPVEMLKALRDRVLAMGDLPALLRKKTGISSPSPSPRKVEFSQDSVDVLYDSLELVHVEGDDTQAYYFPEDLRRVESVLKTYLRSAEWEEERINKEVPSMTRQALTRLGASLEAIHSLSEIITSEFKRTDLIEATDRFSGAPLDVTQAVKELRSQIKTLKGLKATELTEALQKERGIAPPTKGGGGGVAGALLLAGALAFGGSQAHAETVFLQPEMAESPHTLFVDLSEDEIRQEADKPTSIHSGSLDTGLRRSFSIRNHTAFRNLRGRSLVFRSLV